MDRDRIRAYVRPAPRQPFRTKKVRAGGISCLDPGKGHALRVGCDLPVTPSCIAACGRIRDAALLFMNPAYNWHQARRLAYNFERFIKKRTDSRCLCFPIPTWIAISTASRLATPIRKTFVRSERRPRPKRAAFVCPKSATPNALANDSAGFVMSQELHSPFGRPFKVLVAARPIDPSEPLLARS